MEIRNYYEADKIKELAKKKLVLDLMWLTVNIAIIVTAIIFIITVGEILAFFAVAVVLIVLSVYLSSKIIRRLFLSDYSEAIGAIKKVHREVTAARNIYSSNVNLFGIRRYDKYVKQGIRLTVFISNGEEVSSYQINNVDRRQEEYYEAGGEAIHLWGAHYPVKAPTCEEWLCPICGAFNSKELKVCDRCKTKVLK